MIQRTGSFCAGERIGVEFSIPFGGQALNAVDGKGRVSLPADLRATVDRRAAQALTANMPVDDKLLYIAEDEELPCLTGFDETEYFALAGQLQERRASETASGSRKSLIRRDGGGKFNGFKRRESLAACAQCGRPTERR